MTTDAAGTTLATGDGRKVVLGKLIKSGGAGSVYRLEESTDQVAKLYHPGADLRMYERRIAAMLELEPQLPALAPDDTRYVQLAWPDAPLRDARGQFLGYLMPVVDIDATDELEYVLQERQALRLGLPTGLGAKVTLAANLCAVIAALHRERHYIVDLKPVNLRFYRRSLYMAMLDCDGFSIQGRGERFEAPQYTPDYLAPEFHLRELGAAGEAQQDRFALAVVVFQLLNFGIHPFTGRPQSTQVPTDIPARIAGRWYAYGLKSNPALLPNLTSGHAAMPHELRVLFDRAFDEQVSRGGGGTRPSADEWSDLLRGYAQRAEGKLVACQRNDAHQHFAGRDCAACARSRTLADARAAEARRPPRTRLVTRPSPLAVALAMQAGKPATPAPSGTSSIPPHVLAKINQAWARQAQAAPPPAANVPATPLPPPAAAPRRPANWSNPASSPARSLPVLSIVAIVAVAMMFAVLVSKGIGDRPQGALVEADPAAVVRREVWPIRDTAE
jgi:DNA-binding helix-hairpin-helix protein with protein kinase domain